MKDNFPKIKFVYSPIYDAVFTEYEGKYFNEKQKEEAIEYIQKLQKEWQKINRPVFEFLLKIFPNDYKNKEIICYVIKYFKFSGISHPLTIKITKDVREGTINLIHELIHIFLSPRKWEKISQKLAKEFPNEKPEMILHIYINFTQLQILKKIFKKSVIEKILKKNRRLKRTGKAWEIVLKEEAILHKLFNLTNH